MRSDLNRPWLSLVAVLVGCGGAPPQPVKAGPSEAEVNAAAKASGGKQESDVSAEEKAAELASRQVPTTCETADKVCLPPVGFVKRLCGGFHPDAALALFAKGTPFTRGYLTRDTEAWNASGGSSSSDKLLFDEEVLVLYRRVPDTGGMVVSGSGGGYDVLRWDGTCASLMAEEVRLNVPAKPKFAPIPWKSLDAKTREALEADEKVGKVVSERRKECKGATIGSVTAKCEKVDKQMSAAIVDYIRGGGALPAPGPLP
jgi:hypothetical protein